MLTRELKEQGTQQTVLLNNWVGKEKSDLETVKESPSRSVLTGKAKSERMYHICISLFQIGFHYWFNRTRIYLLILFFPPSLKKLATRKSTKEIKFAAEHCSSSSKWMNYSTRVLKMSFSKLIRDIQLFL